MVETIEELRVGEHCPLCGEKVISWEPKAILPEEYDGQADCVWEFDSYVVEINHGDIFA